MSEDLSLLLSMIQECIRTGRYAIHPHGLKHPLVEGFTPRQAIESILNGTIIEHYPGQFRCLTCGSVPDLDTSSDYISTYIHCVCAYDDIQQVVVITMYRPRSDRWINQFRRRPGV